MKHDIHWLFKELKKKIKKKRFKDILAKKLKQNPNSPNLKLIDNFLPNSDTILNKLEVIINQYSRSKAILERSNLLCKRDKKNTFFRYPEYPKIKYERLISEFCKKDIMKILRDIRILQEEFDSLSFVIDVLDQPAFKSKLTQNPPKYTTRAIIKSL